MQHPDEGTIHAWLDGELPEDQANEIAAHARDCPECSATVAEARGLIAASTRILTALDNVPAGVIPAEATAVPTAAAVRRRPWYDRTDIRAAAAVLVVAGASYLVVNRNSGSPNSKNSSATFTAADQVQTAPLPPASTAERAAAEPTTAAPRGPQSAARKKPAPVAAPEANKPMAKAATARGESRERSTALMDAMSATVRDTVPSAAVQAPAPAMLLPQATLGRVAVTSKRGNRSDSANSTSKGVAGDVASGVARALGVVEGRIVDKKNDQGLAGASVILGPALGATTDKDGRFSITNVPAGEQQLKVRRIGYVAQSVPVAVPDDASVTANVALEPQMMTLSQVVVTSAAAAPGNAASPSLHVMSVDTTTAIRRTVYEISPGVRVTLSDSPVDTGKEEAAFGGQLKGRAAGVLQRSANASDEKAASNAVNTISWTERGHRYELSGPVPVKRLQALKQQLMEQKR
jgi:hypothetical protein